MLYIYIYIFIYIIIACGRACCRVRSGVWSRAVACGRACGRVRSGVWSRAVGRVVTRGRACGRVRSRLRRACGRAKRSRASRGALGRGCGHCSRGRRAATAPGATAVPLWPLPMIPPQPPTTTRPPLPPRGAPHGGERSGQRRPEWPTFCTHGLARPPWGWPMACILARAVRDGCPATGSSDLHSQPRILPLTVLGSGPGLSGCR
jgi:hypothetical protein